MSGVKSDMMLKSAMMLGSMLCAGILIGVTFAIFGPFTGSTANAPPTPPRLPTVGTSIPVASQVDASSSPATAGSPSPRVSTQGEATTPIAQQLAAFGLRLDEESAIRKRLEAEVSGLQNTLQILEQRLGELAERKSAPEDSPPRVGRSRQINPATLVEAGFRQDEAESLTALWGQQQMDLLYLRDQASREGWLNTPRYAQAVREFSNATGSMREEVGLDTYDRFLFAAGHSNRVVLHSVIESSPAQAIGLQPGDTIVTYDGTRILSVHDLQAATTAGEPDVPVVIEVDRGGQLMEFEIARGPIGVTLGTRRVEP